MVQRLDGNLQQYPEFTAQTELISREEIDGEDSARYVSITPLTIQWIVKPSFVSVAPDPSHKQPYRVRTMTRQLQQSRMVQRQGIEDANARIHYPGLQVFTAGHTWNTRSSLESWKLAFPQMSIAIMVQISSCMSEELFKTGQ